MDTVWADSADRAQLEYWAAVETCHEEGGHLPTKRDMVELIRGGLPPGADAWYWTSDMTARDTVAGVRWTSSTYLDQNGTDATDLNRTGAVTAYFRCVWSNAWRHP